MSNPVLGAAKKDKLLTQFSQRYTNTEYISEQILPVLKVKEKTGNYAKYGTENLRAYTDGIFRAPGTRALSVDYSVSQGAYSCRERALEKKVPDEYVNNTDDPYDAKRDAVATIMDNIWVNQELALATYMASGSNITQNTTLSGTDQWSDYVNSAPFDDIETGQDTIFDATGKEANTATMSRSVMKKLKYHPDVREQLKYTGAGGNVSNSAFLTFMKEFFELTRILIGKSIYDSADEGQTASLAAIWGNHFWLTYTTDRPSLMNATFGYTFTDVARQVDKYRDESIKSEYQRVAYSYDQNVMDTSLAYGVFNAIA